MSSSQAARASLPLPVAAVAMAVWVVVVAAGSWQKWLLIAKLAAAAHC